MDTLRPRSLGGIKQMTRGGPRLNAGRKKLSDDQKKQTIAMRLSPHVIEILKNSGSPGELVEKLVKEYEKSLH